jgi:hypothetical protein
MPPHVPTYLDNTLSCWGHEVLRQRASPPALLECLEQSENAVGHAGSKQHSDERLGKFTSGYEVIVDPGNGEVLFPHDSVRPRPGAKYSFLRNH